MKIKDKTEIAGLAEDGLPLSVGALIAWQVGSVARRFRLSEVDREELASHVCGEVVAALQTKYNPQRASVITFANGVVRNCLRKWVKAEVKRRNHFVAMTPELEARLEEMPMPDSAHMEELLRIARVRQTVAALSPLNRRICELYMKYASFDKVCKAIHKTPRDFFKAIWPRCQAEFKKIYEKSDSGLPCFG